jgi:branched-chain amino acid transport system permease protein
VLQYVVAGLALGAIYAISAAGLVVTYLSAGVLNFAFGAIAFFVARFYYYLDSQQHWGILPSAVVSLLVVGPALGLFLYGLLFRLMRQASALVQVVATLGVSVAIPPVATLLFGNRSILAAPGLAPQPVHVFHPFGVPVTLDKVIIYASVILVVAAGAVALRYTDIGLRVRAMVDSPAMTSLSGTNPSFVAAGVWAVSTFLAGLSGVLSAPIIGLDPTDYTIFMAAAFAAVVAARLRSLPVAVAVGLLMGVAGDVLQRYLPSHSVWAKEARPSIPFVVTALFLLYYMVRSGRVDERQGVGGALDRSIAVKGDEAGAASTAPLTWRLPMLGVAVVAALPWILHSLWVGLLATGVAYAVVFLSFTLVTGEGGMVWLCMITFAGIGALTTGQLAEHGWPILAAVAVGGVVALPAGIVIGLLTIRLGDLYVALVTLTFGILMEQLVFSSNRFVNNGIGVNLNRPGFAVSDRAFTYMALGAFAIISIFVFNLRRATTGLALSAVRSSEEAASTTGISVVAMKLVVAGLGAFVAGVGGGLLAVDQGVALPSNYATLLGVVWLAVLVTQGIRSNVSALIAGIAFAMLPQLASDYLPSWGAQVPSILFGLGAIAVVRNPDGVLADQLRQVRKLAGRSRSRPSASMETAPGVAV